MSASGLTHIDPDGRPAMVDVSEKQATARQATAQCLVGFPAEVAAILHSSGDRSAKGPVIDTAIIAGTMAAKRTHELIPFCHPLPIDKCSFSIVWADGQTLSIRCTVATVHRTGVEMEALTGATIAGLVVYDMCKAMSHEIIVGPVTLLAKSGGKNPVGGA